MFCISFIAQFKYKCNRYAVLCVLRGRTVLQLFVCVCKLVISAYVGDSKFIRILHRLMENVYITFQVDLL